MALLVLIKIMKLLDHVSFGTYPKSPRGAEIMTDNSVMDIAGNIAMQALLPQKFYGLK